jgi:hypothetical protein
MLRQQRDRQESDRSRSRVTDRIIDGIEQVDMGDGDMGDGDGRVRVSVTF